MKTAILFSICFSLCFIKSCKVVTQNHETDCATVLMDITDSFGEIASIKSGYILPILRVSHDSLYGAKVTVAPITNLRFNHSKTVCIPSENMLEHNEFDRKIAIQAFKSNLDSCLCAFNKRIPGTDGSYVFFAIANALKDLVDCKECDTKILIVYSDCRENSKFFDSYDKQSIKFIQHYPERIAERLDKTWPIQKSLEGVKIYLVHQPTTTSEDDIFFVMSRFMQSYYQAKGASVIINSLPAY